MHIQAPSPPFWELLDQELGMEWLQLGLVSQADPLLSRGTHGGGVLVFPSSVESAVWW